MVFIVIFFIKHAPSSLKCHIAIF